ncbi:MAG: M14 family metallocarboxypeptidase [Gammaproteobacteria bacterium]|nr:M14 family metallocarboxypeptidase [Gammaproteobacteria bacterium]MBU1476389.1 M14 family metallocarboxypeptidase [Gammaproteobacteria bacterium]MBU2003226.1 M14 family metallocarboxypeptidase [Gammaproteobacteria bacterium]MBU2130898.1 M14 family metallocarboxypeptidase [Gammaproteobacteria bacterium]MBU2185447.1 M14 family metallocarboxypeptidase [Gammaproteobacteria bacterium]
MANLTFYPIGTAGEKWGESEKAAWLASTQIKRSYQDDVVTPLKAMEAKLSSLRLGIVQYGALSINADRYPLFAVKSQQFEPQKPTVLVTGGVHGYETSGVHGALAFLANEAANYVQQVNLVVAVCVSPWGYETINRWNPKAIDPNRSFYANSPAEESVALMALVTSVEQGFDLHVDLHETTDSDELEFRPALSARDGIEYEKGTIPDGFYAVGDTENSMDAFQKAIIDGVSKVTHIAPADEKGEIIGSTVVQHGVINYPLKSLGLCSSVTGCIYNTTTEVYPDSPTATPAECNLAQVAAITSAIDYVLAQR